jgi:hypothetical protein
MQTVLEYYQGYCAPVACASARGTTPAEVAAFMIVSGHMERGGGVHIPHISEYLGRPYRPQPRWRQVKGDRAFPTLSQWLREHPVGSFVVFVHAGRGAHVVHVEGGTVRADSAPRGSLRYRVRGYWVVRWGPS